ncbi:alpha/beta hydrolase family protein [Virgibacillus pantothenticus]|uniref:Peptidase S9 n=1 Tax=Virgibacillus pantothenticus TaxID=1473 RepID=A0A0L0QMY0_VIRPA|nr:S9 family peptidase [Virgibacillus pantothenticus]KNE19879.1 peptidase S9 [Virgibacillus pantothenticus]MED3737944.1 S9 family peptidase [Virgibacillus pantothenticus]QTY14574.1 S9 family peptidase [Virgibacillus pantothenticus]SIS61653.1 Dipeptidyl aminopeptidase/acylaminoacyl peptidase [Virgibacillus pantothenticus]
MEQSLLKEYLQMQHAYEPIVIPGQQDEITFLTKKTGLPQVWKLNLVTTELEQFTDLPDRVLSVFHSPTGQQTIVGMDEHGNEKQQFYLMDSGRRNVQELVVSKQHFHYFGGWSPDGKQIAFSSNRRSPGIFDVFVLDLRTKKQKVVFESDGNCKSIFWSKDGSQLLIRIPETNIEDRLFLLDIATGSTVRLGDDSLARFKEVELTANGKEGFVLTDIQRDTLAIYQFSLNQPAILTEVLSDDNWDIEELKLSPNQRQLAFTVNEGGRSKLGVYHLDVKTYDYIETLPKGVYNSVSWVNDQELILHIKSAVLPGDIWQLHLGTGSCTRLTHIGHSEITKYLIEPNLFTYPSFDGLNVPYFFYGDVKQSQPAVIYVHGGPEYQIRDEFNPVIQYLAANGFAVAVPNVRGSMGYGRTYSKLDDQRKRMNAVADLKWLVEDLVQNRGVNRDQIGIMGRSYGGFMVLAAITHYPDLWAAAVDIVGISHFKTFLENTGPWRRKLREYEYGSLKEDVDFFEEIAPLRHTANIQAPLLIFHGRNDTRVPVSEAEQLASDLQKQGKNVELLIFEDEGHQTEKMTNHITMNKLIIAFMQKHLAQK